MNDQIAQQILNELRKITAALERLSGEVGGVAHEIKRK
jgi:hypothetical protein